MFGGGEVMVTSSPSPETHQGQGDELLHQPVASSYPPPHGIMFQVPDPFRLSARFRMQADFLSRPSFLFEMDSDRSEVNQGNLRPDGDRGINVPTVDYPLSMGYVHNYGRGSAEFLGLDDGSMRSSISSREGSTSAPSSISGRSRSRKFCEVCGDVAKSLHFGGLSCDSCKAFFRRSVHKDGHLQFQCGYDNTCHISKHTRKACQKCRFEKCLRIGMEKKWVMSEEERRALNERRNQERGLQQKFKPESKASAQVQVSPASSEDGNENDLPEMRELSSPTYSPNVDEMLNYMSQAEQDKIREVCEAYRLSYDKIPYNVPSTTEGSRSSVQVISMFTTILRRFAYFSKLIPEFKELEKDDQGNLLKASVLEMVMLRGALSFDVENNRWPNPNLEFLKNCPQLKVEDMENLVSPELFEMHMSFIRRIQKLKVDEPTVMLLLLIVMFTPERSDVVDGASVSATQETYCDLLRKYVDWRYGPDGNLLYPKLLTALSDLRQLNDLHTEYHLNLRETEVNVIRQDLSQLNLNPYPQWKIVEDSVPSEPPLLAPTDLESQPGPTSPERGGLNFNINQQMSPQPELQTSPTSNPTSRRPIRSSNVIRAHTRMREAFLKKIPQLIDDPFAPLMSLEDISHFKSFMTQGNRTMPNPTGMTAGAQGASFDPWQHRHHDSQRSSTATSTTTRSQDEQPFVIPNLNEGFDGNMEKLMNIQNIMENLDAETRARLQSMFTASVTPGVSGDRMQIPMQGRAGSSQSSITPGYFTDLCTSDDVQNQIDPNPTTVNVPKKDGDA